MTTTTSTSRRSSSDGSRPRLTIARPDGAAHVCCSTVADGDFHPDRVPPDELRARRRALVDLPWASLAQHHGTAAVEVDPSARRDGDRGDVLATGADDIVLGCWVADCAPVVLIGHGHRIAVAHAGWRGLAAGVLDAASAALAEPVATVVLGPTIGPCCYEFGADDLAAVADGLAVAPETISSVTRDGTLALDVPAAVRGFADRHGAGWQVLGGCPGCTYPGFSHRVRGEAERHVVAVWQTRSAA